MARKTRTEAAGVLRVGDVAVAPGTRARIDLPVARLPVGGDVSLPVAAVAGGAPGPTVWLDAAIHGDELNGVEIIQRVLAEVDAERLCGNLLAVPIVNVFGFIQQSRYLPDRRDLNRSFPGSAKGSLAARLAHLFLDRIVALCDYGIDLHTGSLHRTNLPQIRADLDDPETRRLAEAFGAPLIYKPRQVKGSLRAAVARRRIPLLLFEGGEPQRFNEDVIELGYRGVMRVMAALDMWHCAAAAPPTEPAFEASGTRWVRAPRSGIFHLDVGLGERVEKGRVLGEVSDPLSADVRQVRAPFAGLVLGFTKNPLVFKGDALAHLARPVAAAAAPA